MLAESVKARARAAPSSASARARCTRERIESHISFAVATLTEYSVIAKEAVNTRTDSFKMMLSGASEQVKAKAASMACRCTDAVTAARQARAEAWCRVLSLQCLIRTLYSDLQQKGVREWSKDMVVDAKAAISQGLVHTRDVAGRMRAQARQHATWAVDSAKATAAQVNTGLHSAAGDRRVQVSAASAASGAVAFGASGGAAGLAAGSAVGAAIGLAPAIFTFGLSIPIGAFVGGSSGLLIGTALGGTCGAIGAGAAGYGAFTKRDEIGQCAGCVKAAVSRAAERASEAADSTKARAYASAGYVVEKASVARTRLVGRSGTGGTEAAE